MNKTCTSPYSSKGMQPAPMGSPIAISPVAASETKLLIFVPTEKTTPFSPIVSDTLARAKKMYTQWNLLIEKLRNMAQPNPAFRGERLVASAVGAVSNRMQYSGGLKVMSAACFDDIQPLGDYMNEMAAVQQAISGFHDVMLRQTMLYSVKPLKDYVTQHYPKITNAYNDLVKKRDSYDSSRNKFLPNMLALKQQLLEQAAVLETLFKAIPDHQLQGAKAIDTFVRAEHQYMKETVSVTRAVVYPDNKRRWSE